MATTTLTAQQLQQIANSQGGQVLSSALQNVLRGVSAGNPVRGTTQYITRPATGAGSQGVIRSQTIIRSGQPQPRVVGAHAPTIALQRPTSAMTAQQLAAVTGPQVRLSGAGPRLVTSSPMAGQQRQVVVATGAGQAAGQQGVTRQIVMSQGGTPVRSGQILQVTGTGGQQHQIVVSQSGQFIINPPSSKS